MFDLVGNAVDSAFGAFDDFVEDPVGQTIHHTTAPIRNSLDILEGLTEGEIRTMAVAKLGADVVSGMALSEVVDLLADTI